MNALFAIPISGLEAQSKRLAVSANNVANLRTTTPANAAPEAGAAFVPTEVVDVSLAGGGVQAEERAITPASIPVYEPSHPDADEAGVVAYPNVSLKREVVNQIQAEIAYKANAKVIEALDEQLGTLLNIDT